jgi:hypothetical protein
MKISRYSRYTAIGDQKTFTKGKFLSRSIDTVTRKMDFHMEKLGPTSKAVCSLFQNMKYMS